MWYGRAGVEVEVEVWMQQVQRLPHLVGKGIFDSAARTFSRSWGAQCIDASLRPFF